MGKAFSEGYVRPGRRIVQLAVSVTQIVLFAGSAQAFNVRLGWSPVLNAQGYRVYTRQSGQSYGAGLDVGLIQPSAGVVRYTVTGLPNGVTNYMCVAAYDSAGRVGVLSNELSLNVTATPTVQPSSTPTHPPIATSTPSRTSTRIPTGTATPSHTPTRIPTGTATSSRTPTRTPTLIVTSTSSPTPTRTPTVIGTATTTKTQTPQSATSTATRTTTGTPTYTATPTPATIRKVWFQDRAHVNSGMTASVPVKIAAGSGVRSIAISATYDPNVVMARAVQLSGLAVNGTLNSSLTVPGRLVAAATVIQPVLLRTEVFRVSFMAVGPCGSDTDVQITSCLLDGGAVGCKNATGHIAVRCP